MQELKHNDLERIIGGASPWVIIGIASIAVFISGVIEGIVHPKSCSS